MGACFQAPHATPGQKPMEMKLVVFSFIFITCQWSSAGGSWIAKLLINILFVIWTAPLYGVPYKIGPGCSASFRPHRTIALPLLTVQWGMKLLINLWPIPKNLPKGGRQEEIEFGIKSTKDVLVVQIMGACFQAPRAAPGQRLMETYIGACVWAIWICLTILSFHRYPYWHCLLIITKCPKCLDWCAGHFGMSCLELLTIFFSKVKKEKWKI